MLIWKNISYQIKLFCIFILLSIIPVTLIGTIAYQKSSLMLNSQMEQNLNVILAQLAASIERQISDFDRFSMLPYYLPDVFSFLNKTNVSPEKWGSADFDAQKTMTRLMSAYPSISSSINGLMVYGMNGTVNGYRVSGNSAINSNVNIKNDDWYQRVLAEKGGFVITGVKEFKQFQDKPFKSIIGSRLIMDNNYRPFAVIAIFISPDFIRTLVNSLELPNVQVTVLDGDRKLLYASDGDLAERLRTIGLYQKKGTWELGATEASRKNFTGVFLKSDYLGWVIYMGVDGDEMLRGSQSIQHFTIAIIIIVGLIAAIIAWLLARGLSRPINRLIRSMRQVEMGKFSLPVYFERGDEIGRLENSFGMMVKRLDELVYSIEEKERQKRHAEMNALRARIQPHFLYNTLNSIRMLAILQQSNGIAELIYSLNRLLHANMKLDIDLVTLNDETRLLKDYATLMDLRYTNSFEIRWLIPNEIGAASIPPMLLQPLLENAIFHGGKGLTRKLHIVIEARIIDNGERIVVEIADDGTGMENFASCQLLQTEGAGGAGNNIGLRNVQDRIRLRFGEEYGLKFRHKDNWTVVTVIMPYQLLKKEMY